MKNTTILATLVTSAITATAGVVAPAPAACPVRHADPCAGPISYNNVELLYAYTDYDGSSDNGNGGALRVEYSAWDNFYLAAGASYHEVNSVDMWALSAGVGGYVALSENIHLVAEVGGLWTSFDTLTWVDDGSSAGTGNWVSDNDEEWGWYIRPHIRAKYGCFEAHAGALYTDLGGDWGDEWAGFVNIYYQVSPGWDLTAGVTFSSDTTTVTGGARYRY